MTDIIKLYRPMKNITAILVPMSNFSYYASEYAEIDDDLTMNWEWDFLLDFYARKFVFIPHLHEWEKWCTVEIQRHQTAEGVDFYYTIHERLTDGRTYTYPLKKLDPQWVDQTMETLVDYKLAVRLNEDEITRPEWKYAALVIYGDVEPSLYDNFKTEQERDQFMKKYREENGNEDRLYFVQYAGRLEIDSPSRLFFEEEE